MIYNSLIRLSWIRFRNKKNKQAFTLIELLVVIVIFGILASLTMVGLSSVRIKSRDVKRISDIKQMQTALELFLADNGRYPTSGEFAVGAPLDNSDASKTYLSKVPSNPLPRTDGGCMNSDYVYSATGTTYGLNYCLGTVVNNVSAGAHTAAPEGIVFPCTATSCTGTDACCKSDGTCGTYGYNTITAGRFVNATQIVCSGDTYNYYFWGCMIDASANRWINGTACTGCRNVTQVAYSNNCICCGGSTYTYSVQCKSNICQ